MPADRCDTGQCLVASRTSTGLVLLWNNSYPDVVPLVFTVAMWESFLLGVHSDMEGWKWFRSQDDIEYTIEEASDFREGVLAGRFDYGNLPCIDGC